MLEYIFFHKLSLDQFIEQLEQRSIPCEVRDDEMGLVAAVADDLDEALIEQVDEIYEALMDSTRKLLLSELRSRTATTSMYWSAPSF